MKHLLAASTLCLVNVLFVGTTSTFAQEPVGIRAAMIDAARALPSAQGAQMAAGSTVGVERSSGRPSFLMQSLYATTIVVQGLDAHSTFRAIDAGGKEGNPLVGSLAERRPAFLALKGAISTATIYAARDLSKRHKVAAVLTLIGINSAYAALIANNYRVVAHMKAQQ